MEGTATFAPRVAKAQTKAVSSPHKLAPQRSTLAGRPLGEGPVELAHMLQRTIGNQATLRLLSQQTSSLTGNEPCGTQEREVNPEGLMAREAPGGVSRGVSGNLILSPDGANRLEARSSPGAPHLPRIIQPKLVVGEVDDPLEHEADRVADQVMRMPDPGLSITGGPPQVSRKCDACEQEEKRLRMERVGGTLEPGGEAPSIVHEVLQAPGTRLDPPTRAFFEPRFGADFTDVRLHTDAAAAASAQAVGALAYAVGRDLVFAPGAYMPAADAGRRLIAHELTHVLQNGHGGAAMLRRDTPADAGAPPPTAAAGQTAACPQPTPVCPPEYCKPFPNQQEAVQDRAAKGEGILGDIKLLNSRAEPLFRQFIFDPAPAGDISATFASDFTNCAVSRETTQALQQKLQAALQALPPAFPPGGGSVTLNITALLSPKEITDFVECRMVFDDYTSVPGLIAGGVGKTQESVKTGKNTTGAVNDSRSAAGTLTVSRNTDGSFGIVPNITYTVVDTLDFCPGNCGGGSAQGLTVPLSRWEASAISGDVPFRVVFPAPSLIGAYDSEEG